MYLRNIILLLIFGCIGKLSFSQNDLYQGPNFFIAMTWGYSFDCEENGNAYLQLQDSTLIPFNEHSTFEDRLVLDDRISILPGNYRILFITKESGILESISFTVTSDHRGEPIEVEFDSLTCCQATIGTYLLFEQDSIKNAESVCSGIENFISRLNQDSLKYEIVAIFNDQISQELAEKRIETIKSVLVENNVNTSELLFRTERRQIVPYFHIGNIVYDPDECLCCPERLCQTGIVLIAK